MKVELEYCAAWGYEPEAVGLTDHILGRFKRRLGGLTLVPSAGGCFEVRVDGELVYSKLKTKQFPDPAAVLALIEQRLAAGG